MLPPKQDFKWCTWRDPICNWTFDQPWDRERLGVTLTGMAGWICFCRKVLADQNRTPCSIACSRTKGTAPSKTSLSMQVSGAATPAWAPWPSMQTGTANSTCIWPARGATGSSSARETALSRMPQTSCPPPIFGARLSAPQTTTETEIWTYTSRATWNMTLASCRQILKARACAGRIHYQCCPTCFVASPINCSAMTSQGEYWLSVMWQRN